MLEIRKLWRQHRVSKPIQIDSPIENRYDELLESLGTAISPDIHEVMYSYLMTYPGSADPTAGRFRMVLYEVDHPEMHQISGICEQWSTGWVHCFQLIDDYDDVDSAIDRMLEMMKTFLTGKSESQESPDFTPSSIRKKRPKRPKANKWDMEKIDRFIKKSKPNKDVKSINKEAENDEDSSDDFEWI